MKIGLVTPTTGQVVLTMCDLKIQKPHAPENAFKFHGQ